MIYEMLCHFAPAIGIIGYLAYPKNLRIDTSFLHYFSVIHNTFLIGFSAWTFLSLSKIIWNRGIVFETQYYFQDPNFDIIAFYFYLSKYYEFFDTFLLYLNGKTPLFLQKYHHVGAVLSWHLMYVYKVDMILTVTLLNSFVHTVMYSYYLCCILKINVRFLKQYITSMQLCQFIVLYSNFYYYYPPVETWFNYGVITFFALYGMGVIYLFAEFYYQTYLNVRAFIPLKNSNPSCRLNFLRGLSNEDESMGMDSNLRRSNHQKNKQIHAITSENLQALLVDTKPNNNHNHE
jgi:hypothetical protein